jgi:hypothetical protein
VPIDFAFIAAAIFYGHGRFPWEYWDRLTWRTAVILARKPDPDGPVPGTVRMSPEEADVVREQRRRRRDDDPWGVRLNGWHV